MEQLLEILKLLTGGGAASGLLYGLIKLLKFIREIWREHRIFKMCEKNPSGNIIEVEVTTKSLTNTETIKIKSSQKLPP